MLPCSPYTPTQCNRKDQDGAASILTYVKPGRKSTEPHPVLKNVGLLPLERRTLVLNLDLTPVDIH